MPRVRLLPDRGRGFHSSNGQAALCPPSVETVLVASLSAEVIRILVGGDGARMRV